MNFTVSHVYNAFGEEKTRTTKIDATNSLVHSYTYDRRGLLKTTVWDAAGINSIETRSYDAFGRLTGVTDPNTNPTATEYDKRGRVIKVTDPLTKFFDYTYDAFDRVLTQKDKLGKITAYAYDTAQRKVSITTPENVVMTNTRNAHGETVSVSDGNTVIKTYVYDKNGNLKTATDASGTALSRTTQSNTYDKADRLIETLDARTNKTTYTYQADKRDFTRTVDSGGLNLNTIYSFDGKGQQVTVTDANLMVTRTESG